MVAVAVGHWLALVAVADGDQVVAGNVLEFVPGMAWASWPLQVMPLFFVVGGFSSAVSLDSHNRAGGPPQDWIAGRLRRMLPPAAALATTWLVVIILAFAAGRVELATMGAHAAAVPLWFLANYTIDTALAPLVLPRFRANPKLVAGTILGVFALFEGLRVAAVPFVPPVNWVVGWLLFQVLGFAWRDGLLPSGRRLVALAAGAWVAVVMLVLSGGPWAISMVNAPGMEHSPTNPPTLALLVFGAAYSCTAIALAPAVSRALTSHHRAWLVVVAANSVAMTIYLWHMTATVIVTAALHLSLGLPQTVVGSTEWWLWKLPTTTASLVALGLITVIMSPVERRALLAPRRPWNGSLASMLMTAAIASIALKWWTSGNLVLITPSLLVLVALGHTVLRPAPTPPRAPNPVPAATGPGNGVGREATTG
jgi:hypothetical protein